MNYARVVPGRWYAEDPFDSLSSPLRESADEVVREVVMDTSQKILVEMFGIGVCKILEIVPVARI